MGLFSGLGSALVGGALGLIGGSKDREAGREAAALNYEQQKEFAQQGIRWRVDDAKAAGLHPLAALGSQISSFQPSYVDGGGRAEQYRQIGQDIGGAIHNTRPQNERAEKLAELQLKSLELDIQGKEIENSYMASKAAKLNQPGYGPGLPNSSGDPYLSPQAMELTASRPGSIHQEPGAVTDLGFTRTRTGYFPVKSKDATERLEDDVVGNLIHHFRNRFLPTFGANYSPPHEAPAGTKWWFNPLKQEYSLVRLRKKGGRSPAYRSNSWKTGNPY